MTHLARATARRSGAILSSPLNLVLAVVLVGSACDTTQRSPAPSPSAAPAVDWHDPRQAPEARATALLDEMTPDEKIGQMTQLEKDSVEPGGVTDLFLGSVLSGGGGAPGQNDPAGWYRMVEEYQDAALATRLRIPLLYGVDAVHGHNNVVGATIFPHNIGLGAAGDVELVQRIGRATATEMTATGIRWDFAPVVAVPQDVRWGRTYEAYGEDPRRVSDLATAFIRGLHGTDLAAQDAAVATAKHFVGDGGTTYGSSTTAGYLLDQGVTEVDEATLREIHLAPYEAALEADARIVMASFSSTTAGKVHGDRHLITEVLKEELGFSGFVVSDWQAVDQIEFDYKKAVARAINAGIDMVMVPYDGPKFQAAVRDGLASGAIDASRVDDAVGRILRVKFELGLFEQPMPPGGSFAAVGSDEDRALAREAVAASLVLLKASPGALPIDDTDTVLLAGDGADDIGLQSGGWTISWQGSRGHTTPGTTIAEALADGLGDRLTVHAGRDIPAEARADVGIVVLTETPYAEGEGDSTSLALAVGELIESVRPKVDRLVVVILSGRPMILDDVLPQADAVVAAWLPGTEGAGLADVLLGARPYVGTTPFTWPTTPEDAPRTGKAPCDGAVFPLGYGLSVTGELLGPAACP